MTVRYVKTPIQAIYDELRDADGKLFAIGMGSNPNAVEQLKEIALAVNEYDNLVAKNSALVAILESIYRED